MEFKLLEDYLYTLCEKNGIRLQMRFSCFGDNNEFYLNIDEKTILVGLDQYHVNDFEEVKKLIVNTYLIRLWQHAKPEQQIALCVQNIINTGNGYNIIVGGQLFNMN